MIVRLAPNSGYCQLQRLRSFGRSCSGIGDETSVPPFSDPSCQILVCLALLKMNAMAGCSAEEASGRASWMIVEMRDRLNQNIDILGDNFEESIDFFESTAGTYELIQRFGHLNGIVTLMRLA